MSWRTFRLGDILHRRTERIKLYPEKEYKLVTIRLYHKGIVLRTTAKGKNIKSPMSVIKTGDFILSGIDARNGAFGIVPDSLDNAIITNDFWCLDPDRKIIDLEFFLFLTSTSFFDYICKQSSDGTTQRIRLQREKFFNFEISLPSLQEQKSILNSLKFYQATSESLSLELTNQLTLTDQLRQAYLRDAIQGKLVEQNAKDGNSRILLQEIRANRTKSHRIWKPPMVQQDETPFEIPRSWVWCRLGEVIEYADNFDIQKNLQPEHKINYVDIDSIDNCKHEIREVKVKAVKELSTRARRVLKKGYIIYSTVRPYLENIAIVKEDLPDFIGSTGFNVFRTVGIDLDYVFYFLLSPDLNGFFKSMMIGFNSPSITNEQFENTLLPLPPLKEQKRIVQKLKEVLDICEQLEQAIKVNKGGNEIFLQQIISESVEKRAAGILPVYDEEDKGYFKRVTLANYIINQSLSDQNFGDVKFEKLLHIIDYAVIKRHLGQAYYQQAAGPYDNAFTHSYFEHIGKQKLFTRRKSGAQYLFAPGQQHVKSTNYYNYFSAEEFSRIDKMIAYFKTKTYEQPEIVSTLYAVWNNRIIRKDEITDDLLIQDFYDWDEQKAKYDRQRLVSALGWMRRENIVPDGWGKIIEKAKGKSVNKKKRKIVGK